MKKILHFTYAALALAFSCQAAAQINYSEDFDGDGMSWPENEFEVTNEATCSGSNDMYRVMLYGGFVSNLSAETTSSSIGISNGGEVMLTYDYKLVPTGTPGMPVSNEDDWGNFSVYYAASEAGPFTLLETIDTENHVETAACITRTVTFTPANGSEVYLKIEAHLGSPTNQISFYFDNITAEQGPGEPCETEAPDAPANQTVCNGATVDRLEAEGDTILWYSGDAGGEPVADDTELVDGTSYFAAQIPDGGCESEARTEVIVTVITTEAADVENTTQSFCGAGTVGDLAAEATVEGGQVVWYDGPMEGNMLDPETELFDAGHYFAVQVVEGCESQERIEVIALLVNVIEPTAESPQVFEVEEGAETINLYEEAEVEAEGTVTWYATFEDAQNGENAIGEEEMVAAGTYYVTQTMNGCESEPADVVIETVLGTDDFFTNSLRYYPNPVTTHLTIGYDGEIDAVMVFDLQGKMVLETNNKEEMQHLNMSVLEMGSYMVKVVSGGSLAVLKIVKL